MLRMEIALFLMLAFVGYIYVSAEKQRTPLHKTFSLLLVTVLVHLVFDGITVYTVNHLDTVPRALNDGFHRLFIGTMILAFYLFYQYIAILVEQKLSMLYLKSQVNPHFLYTRSLSHVATLSHLK